MFKDDLKTGQQKENEIADYYRDLGLNAVISTGVDKDKDIVISGQLEVKYDRLAPQTGNIAIELKCRGKISGLSTTKSNAWVITTDDGAWVCPTESLKHWVKDICHNTFGEWRLTPAGDNLESEVCLLPYNLIKNYKPLTK